MELKKTKQNKTKQKKKKKKDKNKNKQTNKQTNIAATFIIGKSSKRYHGVKVELHLKQVEHVLFATVYPKMINNDLA